MATLTSSYQYIGRSSAVKAYGSDWLYYILVYAKTSGSTSTGKHTVSVKMRLACHADSTFYGYYTTGSATIDGVSAISWTSSKVPSTAWSDSSSLTVGGYTYPRWVDLKEGTVVIDTDYAEKDVSIEVSWQRNAISTTPPSWLPSTTKATGSFTVTLPQIAGVSVPTVSASTVQMGKSVNIYTNRKSTNFTHTLTYAMGDASGTIGTGVEAGKTWTPPTSLAAYTNEESRAECVITCETYNGSELLGTDTVTITLTIPDATVPTLSDSSIELGDPITIYTPRAADCYEHWISYTLKADGSSTVTFSKEFTGAVQESYEWTPSLTMLAPEIPGATKGTITIICETRFKDSTTVVGTADPVSFTVTIPNNSTTRPAVTMSVSVAETPFSGVYVAGKSKVKVSYSASSDYSTIKSYLTELLSYSSSANPYTSPVLANAGTVEITGKVTDARGYSTTKTASITVIDYSRPRIVPGEGNSKITCKRCLSDGTADPGGTYLLIQIGRKYSKVVSNGTQKNYCKLSYEWKTDAAGDDEYSTPVELLASDASSDYVDVILSDIVTSNTTAYTIRLTAEDTVGETDTVTVTVPTAFVTWHSPVGGHGFTLGGYHDSDKYDVFDCRFDAEFEGNVSGKVLGLGVLPEIPEGADADNYKESGAYAVKTNAVAETLVNFPETVAGTLRVWASNGGSISTDYAYILQEYIPYNNACTYRRYVYLSGESWVYGMWKVTGGMDAIISQGTTNNWYWRKFANGTAECWRRASQTVDIATEWGSMYYGDCEEMTFPFEFTANPIVNTSLESSYSLILGSRGNVSTTAPANVRVFRIGSAQEGASIVVVYHAIGRWK